MESFENSGKLIGLYDKLVECEVIEQKAFGKEESKKHDKNTAIDGDILPLEIVNLE